MDDNAGRRRGERNLWFWMVLLGLCAIGAAVVVRRLLALGTAAIGGPPEIAALDAQLSAKAGLTVLHIVPSLLFVLLVPLQFVSTLRRRRPRLHRWIGRAIIVLGLVIGVSALALSADPFGGVVEATATVSFGSLFLFSLGKAWWHIRNLQVDRHRAWATRMVAVALGVATTRPIMGVFFATRASTGLTPEQFFGPAMWLGFLSTVIAGELWIRHTLRQGAQEIWWRLN